MEVWVSLKFGDGDFKQGFSQIKIQIDTFSTHTNLTQLETHLSPAPEIPSSYERWKKIYDSLTQLRGFKDNKIISVSTECCLEYVESLQSQLNQWLLPIKSQLQPVITSDTNYDIRLFVNTHEIICDSTKNILHHLPWQECDLFGEHSSLEVALSFKDFLSSTKKARKSNSEFFRRIKIISILGDSKNILTSTDEELIIELEKRGAYTTFLKEPKRETLHRLWDEPCDILFFAGHSESLENGKKGIISINDKENLDLEEIPKTLQSAINQGLQLAIFNSCDGLGLARRLAELNLPYVIVWREPVQDKIAQKFLKFFLSSYASGDCLFTAVWKARGKLEELTDSEKENLIPGVNCLPIICVNTLERPPKWEDLGGLSGKLPQCPYKGLSAFSEEDASFFFGREKFVKQLVAAVQKKSFVPVVGASGSGKSSVVFAGLAPSLKNNEQKTECVEIISFRPGNNPFGNLAIALTNHSHSTAPLQAENLTYTQRRLEQMDLELHLRCDEACLTHEIKNIITSQGAKKLVLIADQFEELYTLTPKEKRQSFLDALIYAINYAPKFTLVLTLRADFYGYALSYRPFSDALQKGIYNLSPMNQDELRCAIEKPAHKWKIELQEGLTETLIRDLGNEPGRLPLLEFTLKQLWQKPRKGFLTHEAYQEIGGLEKALANYADMVLNKLSHNEQKRAEKIFIQLVCPGEGTEDTRRVATLQEVGETNWDLVQQLASERLLVTGYDETSSNPSETVEIIHEALIREWGTFNKWIQDNREFRTWQERLKPNVREWQDHKYDGILLQKTPLSIALKWYIERFNELTLQEKEFIKASEEKQNKQEREKKRSNQFTIFGLTTGLAFVSFFATLSEIRRTNAEADNLSAISEKYFTETNHEAALTDAIKAGKVVKSSLFKPWLAPQTKMQVVLTLQQMVYDYRIRNLKEHTWWVNSVSFSPDGNTIASASSDSKVKLWNVKTSKVLNTFIGHKLQVWGVSFSPDGNTIASASSDKTVKLWNVKTGQVLKTFEGHIDCVNGVSFSPDGNTIASASKDGTVKLWNVKTGQQINNLKGHQKGVSSVSFSPNGNTIASASSDGTVKLWNLKTGQQIGAYLVNSEVLGVTFSPDGKKIASASSDNTIKLWDVTTGQQINTLKGHTNWVYSVSFSPDGKKIASASSDGTVKLWDVKTAEVLKTLNSHTNEVISVSFSPDGNTIASASRDWTVKLWDVTTTEVLKTLNSHNDEVIGVSFSPNGNTVASASKDKTVKIWDVKTRRVLNTLIGHTNFVNSVSFSPNGSTVASASSDKTLKLWNVKTGRVLNTFEGHNSEVNSVSFSLDGTTVASASEDGTVKLWNVKTRQVINTFKGHIDGVLGVSFSPDGNTLASASKDGTVKLWNVKTSQEIKTLEGHQKWVYSVSFSPDGNTLASASSDKTVKLWDVKTGQKFNTLKTHTDEVISVSFSPDGNTVASASRDKTVKLWNVTTGREIKTLNGHTNWVNGVSFSRDGKTVASASSDSTVILWNFDLDDLLTRGCKLIPGYLKNNPDVSMEDRKLCS